MDRLPAGERDKRITIMRDVGTATNDMNEHVPDWKPYLKRWAKVDALSGRELWNAQQVQPDVTHQATVLDTGDEIKSAMRVVYKDRTFEIESAIERGEEIVMMLKEAV